MINMPLVRISLRQGKSQLGDCVYRVMVETMNVPKGDRFQVITEHDSGLIYDPEYLGIDHTDGIVFIQVTLNAGRSVETKKQFYARTAALLKDELAIRPEDVIINLVEVPKENWSFGKGEAQYAALNPGSKVG
jgi:phenylpyruvate tautomerase PptA (4-oxalocrotonate tautomerase family)